MMLVHTALSHMRGLPRRDFSDVFATRRILILAPHPDDESLGCGGLIAEACRRGTPPIVAILTDGRRSHPNSHSYPADRLRALREKEARHAAAALGLAPERLVFLRYSDGAAPASGAAMREAAGKVADLCMQNGCDLVTAPWRHDPHCDHVAAATIAAEACRRAGARLLAYPIWGWTLPPDMQIDEEPISGFRLEIGSHVAAKRTAIEAHRSQYAGIIDDDPDGFQMPSHFIERFLQPTETYLEVAT
jgi:LmbE family N-acetylglucosaminyl deacetylase